MQSSHKVAEPFALYLHIPFCHQICPFCAFPITKDYPEKHSQYIQAILNELHYYSSPPKFKICHFEKIKSVYFGGGTPSTLTINELNQIIDHLNLILTKDGARKSSIEWTIELNPEDVNLKYVQGLYKSGFRRISLGIQSFHPQILEKLGRKHTVNENHQALEILYKVGFSNINIDLIFGVPNQSIEDLAHDLEIAISYAPKHISTYLLTIEENSILGRKQRIVDQNTEKLHIKMYHYIVKTLEKSGYHQYEVSNFARHGFQSRQNQLVWSGYDYLGIGPGAHSYCNQKRWAHEKHWYLYQQKIKTDKIAYQFIESISPQESLVETIMVGLRLKSGIKYRAISKRYQIDLLEHLTPRLNRLISQNLIILTEDHFYLTTDGMLLADEIAAWLLAALPKLNILSCSRHC